MKPSKRLVLYFVDVLSRSGPPIFSGVLSPADSTGAVGARWIAL
ncbi:hypothetical protein ACJJIF_06425 [Microbulbifer sp. SSSA002]